MCIGTLLTKLIGSNSCHDNEFETAIKTQTVATHRLRQRLEMLVFSIIPQLLISIYENLGLVHGMPKCDK